MREIVLDTETTGLNPMQGDRIVEIGCIELINHVPTDQHFHRYINPERSMPAEAEAVHGLSETFLSDKPVFADIVDDLVDFLKDSPLVIHNAAFDIGFLNAEYARVRVPAVPMERTVDTLLIARKKYPGAQASLDALCRRFGIDNSARTKHGALLDAELLADVYLELIGGRQPEMVLASEAQAGSSVERTNRKARPARPHTVSPQELARHAEMLALLKEPIWKR